MFRLLSFAFVRGEIWERPENRSTSFFVLDIMQSGVGSGPILRDHAAGSVGLEHDRVHVDEQRDKADARGEHRTAERAQLPNQNA
jgi:hypothetical protein